MGLSTVAAFKTLNQQNAKLKQMDDEQLKKLQSFLLSMVKDFDKVCQKYGLVYNLGGGSCLGAVRHNGFIPWDDDMDLNMPREDYEKFCKVFEKEMSANYWFQTPEKTKGYGLAFARLRKKGTIFRSREDLNNTDEAGIYIDIFIIENTYNFAPMRFLHGVLSMMTGFMLSCRNFYHNRKFYLDLAGNDKKIKKVFRIKSNIGFFLAWLSVDVWTRCWNNVNKMCKNNHSKYVVVPTGRKHFFHELYLRKEFCKTVKHKFEDVELPIAMGYDKYMKNMYGDYMVLPKKNQQETHVFLELDFGDKK